MKILVTGGTGYIGSHTSIELLQAGYEVVIVDNLSNSRKTTLDRIKELGGKNIGFYQADVRDRTGMRSIFDKHKIDSVIHFAGCKAVGESVKKPLKYYSNNVAGSEVLLSVMAEYNVREIVFSSSCTVYGSPNQIPVTEDSEIAPTNPYGRSKRTVELMMKDLYQSNPNWKVSLLRYFNPVGAHPSGKIGEDPLGEPDNLMPYIAQVAVGERNQLEVFGDNYPTNDGTGVRDYIHVVDLADGHLKALEYIHDRPGVYTHNLGTGNGSSVLELIQTFEEVSGLNIPYKITDRRDGDVAKIWADPSKAKKELGWKAKRDLKDMCRDTWNFQKMNV